MLMQEMKSFFYPSSIAVFGVSNDQRNLAKNIILNCHRMAFKGEIYPVGRHPGTVHGRNILTHADDLPLDVELAVILVPSQFVAETIEACGEKGIRHAIISTGGFREYHAENNVAEEDLIRMAAQYGVQFIGPNCIGVICTNSGLCTPFNPIQARSLKKGTTSIVCQSGGVTTQAAYYFSEEKIGFSKIVSAGNKLNLNEINYIKYFMEDDDTEQIHLYLESIENGSELIALAKKSRKPIVVFKSNVSATASQIAYSHTAALANGVSIVDGALKQAGIIRANNIHEMTVCANVFRLPPLRGNRLVVISLSGGFAVMIGDACEKYGFMCPPLPDWLLRKIESFRRGGVIKMSNPMDFGDVHDAKALIYAIEQCLTLEDIDGMVLSLMYDPDIGEAFGGVDNMMEMLLNFLNELGEKVKKPVAVSFFSERKYIDEIKEIGMFPIFNNPVESVQALSSLRSYWSRKALSQS